MHLKAGAAVGIGWEAEGCEPVFGRLTVALFLSKRARHLTPLAPAFGVRRTTTHSRIGPRHLKVAEGCISGRCLIPRKQTGRACSSLCLSRNLHGNYFYPLLSPASGCSEAL